MSRYKLQISRYSDCVVKDSSVMTAAAVVDELQAMEARIAELETEVADRKDAEDKNTDTILNLKASLERTHHLIKMCLK